MNQIDSPVHQARRAARRAAPSPLPPIRIVDFHCEITSEKNAMGWYLDGRVSAVVGTHTHVADRRRADPAEGHRLHQRHRHDRARWSVIGFDPGDGPAALHQRLPTRFEVGDGPVVFNAVQVDVDPATGRALHRADPARHRV
jgi:2',3'-cyclic-nucleotide 2'-phosphodiesterase